MQKLQLQDANVIRLLEIEFISNYFNNRYCQFLAKVSNFFLREDLLLFFLLHYSNFEYCVGFGLLVERSNNEDKIRRDFIPAVGLPS